APSVKVIELVREVPFPIPGAIKLVGRVERDRDDEGEGAAYFQEADIGRFPFSGDVGDEKEKQREICESRPVGFTGVTRLEGGAAEKDERKRGAPDENALRQRKPSVCAPVKREDDDSEDEKDGGEDSHLACEILT